MPKTPTPTAPANTKVTANSHPADPTPATKPDTVAAPPGSKARRRPIRIAIGALIVVLGSLIAAFAVSASIDTVQVVAVRATVMRGQIIKAENLIAVQIRPEPALRTIPADKMSTLVGKRAAMDLHTGGLISPESVADKPIPAAGQAIVGIPLEAGQMPQWSLRSGDKVRIISTPRAQDDPSSKAPRLSIPATVLAVHDSSDQLTVTVVDVVVPAADAEVLGSLVATRRIGLLLDSNG